MCREIKDFQMEEYIETTPYVGITDYMLQKKKNLKTVSPLWNDKQPKLEHKNFNGGKFQVTSFRNEPESR